MVEEPLSWDVQQFHFLGEKVHVVLVLPPAAGYFLECEGSVAHVMRGNIPAPSSEGPDVQYCYRTSGVHPTVDEAIVTGVGRIVIL